MRVIVSLLLASFFCTKTYSQSSNDHFNRGFAKHQAKDYKTAISEYSKAIEVNPNDTNAYYNRAIAKHNVEDFKGAISDYSTAVSLAPTKANSYPGRGRTRHMQNDYKGAIDDYNKDGFKDILLLGNTEKARIKIGKIDANYGTLLIGNGKGDFKYVNQLNSGLNIKGAVRDAIQVNSSNLLITINNQSPLLLKY